MPASSSLKPGSNGFTNRKWFIAYNVGTDYGAGIKIWYTKELIVVNISKYKYCVNRSRDMSFDHFSKNLKIDETGGGLKKRSQAVSCSHSYYKFLSLHVWNDHPLPFNKENWAKPSS